MYISRKLRGREKNTKLVEKTDQKKALVDAGRGKHKNLSLGRPHKMLPHMHVLVYMKWYALNFKEQPCNKNNYMVVCARYNLRRFKSTQQSKSRTD